MMMLWKSQGVRLCSVLISIFLLGTVLAPQAEAGAWVNTNTLVVSRTNIGGGTYRVDVTFKVRRSANDTGPAQKLTVCMHVFEDDFCGDDTIFSGPIIICVPSGGGSSANQTFSYTYPCSWGDDIGVSIESQRAFTGANKTESNLPVGPPECGPGMSMGSLDLTQDVLDDADLHAFFTQNNTVPTITVTRGKEAQGGEDTLNLDTKTLVDPRSLGYDFYHLRGYAGNLEVWDLPMAVAGTSLDPETLSDDEMVFGDPVSQVILAASEFDINVIDRVIIELREAGTDHPTVHVFEGAVSQIPDNVLARWGTLNLGDGVPYDSLLINGSRGDSERVVRMGPFDTLGVEFADFPGANGQPFPYALYVLPRENQVDDITPHPFQLGDGCFSTAVTGGNAVVLLNTLGHQVQLGDPVIGNTPFGPGDVIGLSRQTGFPEIDLTLQAILPDSNSKNGLAALSNGVVVRIGE